MFRQAQPQLCGLLFTRPSLTNLGKLRKKQKKNASNDAAFDFSHFTTEVEYCANRIQILQYSKGSKILFWYLRLWFPTQAFLHTSAHKFFWFSEEKEGAPALLSRCTCNTLTFTILGLTQLNHPLGRLTSCVNSSWHKRVWNFSLVSQDLNNFNKILSSTFFQKDEFFSHRFSCCLIVLWVSIIICPLVQTLSFSH